MSNKQQQQHIENCHSYFNNEIDFRYIWIIYIERERKQKQLK